MPYLLGLTGGIGSGKSTAAAAFARLGVPVVDADTLSRAVTAAGGRAIDAVRAHFGDAFITPEGAMDRAAMRELVFSDPEKRRDVKLKSEYRIPITRNLIDMLTELEYTFKVNA